MHIMNDIQKKTYIDKDETDSMEKQTNEKKQIVCTYNNEQLLIIICAHIIIVVCTYNNKSVWLINDDKLNVLRLM